ncbi:cutinase family protein [Mycobacterium cookii]|uniref:Cutinase n=1 Tax=Mycobacterium cookii TaxID=1775 RepID=A0A7I7L148_9MYCO|nr:cutinase [Mycobacterium cookii]
MVRAGIRALLKLLMTCLLLAGSLVSTSAVGGAADGEPCPDVAVIFARGTLEPPGVGATGQAFTDALNGRLGNTPAAIYPVDYPASLDFNQAGAGVADAANRVLGIVNTCPATKIVVGGYSQGAAIAAYITADSVPPGYDLPAGITGPLPANVANHVAAVTLFGKPSSGFLNLVDHNAPPINIGPRYVSKTIDLCAPQDPVCTSGGGFSRAAHSAYKSNGMTDQAADFAAKAVGR